MNIQFQVSGGDRKAFVKAIAGYLDTPSKYNGMPSCSYSIGAFTVTKEGALTSDEAPSNAEMLVEHLLELGYETQTQEKEQTGVAIQMPLSKFTESQLQNLYTLVEVKSKLIKKALNTTNLSIHILDDRLDFPWFEQSDTPEQIKAYMTFVTALCNMACNQKRITAKEKEVDNEKYAFRCFLLRLGFIGPEYKEARKILLKNFTGSAAFKNTKGGTDDEISK
ncbi:MAG: virulence protein [Acidaminococcaceae bacterium]